MLLVALTLTPPLVLAGLALVAGNQTVAQALGPLATEAPLSSTAWLLMAAAGAAAGATLGGLLWRRGLLDQEDQLLVACQRMALDQPTEALDLPFVDSSLGRLGLAIQIMREALLEQQSHYQRFFDAAHDMFISIAPAGGRILDVNPAFCRCLGLERERILGRKVDSLVNLDMGWERALERQGELLAGHLRGPAGVMRLEVRLSLEKGPAGRPWFLGAIVRDVTDRDRLAQELLRKTRALENALEEIRSVENLKDEFLTTLSHELKTPLVSLKGFLQLLLRGTSSATESQAHLEVCWRNLLKLEKQINNLLDLARLSQSKEQFQLQPVDLARLLALEWENLRPTAAENNVSLIIAETPPDGAMVRGNADKLIQLLDNLIVNAVKYNKRGGEVQLGIARRDGQVVLRVTDSGVGIAREHMANIFNRFYRADITGTGRLEGLGIGLALVQEIVKLHGGDIAVESELGRGTIFTVTLEALN